MGQACFAQKMGTLMFRSLSIATSLTALALASAGASIALASEAQPALNIGFVLYSKGSVPGTLSARWTYQNIYSGKGLATGGPKEGYAGHYHVRYYDEQGKFSDEYDLVIEKAGAFYNASWITNGKVSAGGVGMEVENGLAIGWRRVVD
jgi:hypothetical protein